MVCLDIVTDTKGRHNVAAACTDFTSQEKKYLSINEVKWQQKL